MKPLAYYRRILQAYLGKGTSQLSFWHETPAVNEPAFGEDPQQYYMSFLDKARYAGPFDERGVPLLDYRGEIGRQYNPIAVTQYGLGCFNRYRQEGSDDDLQRAVRAADWLADNLEPNQHGVHVWMHKFDWEYFRTLRAPWYSGLAQGQGLSLLTRVAHQTGRTEYIEAAGRAFAALVTDVTAGGTLYTDADENLWIEEYITAPATHILNGFMWALWGVYDYAKSSGDLRAEELWQKSLLTLEQNLCQYDCGFWSLYDLSPTRIRNVASPFYHQLHLVQLDVMRRLTGLTFFGEMRDRWAAYANSRVSRSRAFAMKAVFKLLYF